MTLASLPFKRDLLRVDVGVDEGRGQSNADGLFGGHHGLPQIVLVALTDCEQLLGVDFFVLVIHFEHERLVLGYRATFLFTQRPHDNFCSSPDNATGRLKICSTSTSSLALPKAEN